MTQNLTTHHTVWLLFMSLAVKHCAHLSYTHYWLSACHSRCCSHLLLSTPQALSDHSLLAMQTVTQVLLCNILPASVPCYQWHHHMHLNSHQTLGDIPWTFGRYIICVTGFSMHKHCGKDLNLGLGRFGFSQFGSIRFGFQSQVLGFGFFSVSVFAHHHNARVSQCVKTLSQSR